MRLRDIFLTGFCLLLVPGFGSAAGARDAGTITKIESRKLPAAEVKRRTLEQLSRILVFQRYPVPKGRPKHPLSDLWFLTKPRETSTPGLCAVDSLTVNFRPTRLPTIGADTPTAAESIEAHTVYRFVVLPTSTNSVSRDWPLGPDNPDCLKINPAQAHMFNAASEENAVEGIWLAGEMGRQAQSGRMDFDVSCNDEKLKREECTGLIERLGQDNISSIDLCEAESSLTHCLAVFASTPSAELEIRLFLASSGTQEMIKRVVVDKLVVVADERAD
jgi:hypothetical protein